jgi:hypothetical protein
MTYPTCNHDPREFGHYAGRRGQPRTVTVCTTCRNGGTPDPAHTLWANPKGPR